MNSPTTATSTRRLRAKCACIPCSTRKRRCNGTYPCTTCRRYGYHCSYRHSGRIEESHPTNYLVEPRQRHHDQQQHQQRTTPPRPSQSQSRSPPQLQLHLPLQQQPPHQETSEIVQESNNGYLITPSSRYLGRHSLETFPRYLALHLQAETLPQLQPFLWNLQTRQVPHCAIKASLCSLITLDMAITNISATFATEFPVCGCLDLETLIARCQNHWAGINQGLAFEALIAGIIGLAAVLTPVTLQFEVDIVRHAETILTDQAILTEPNIEVLAAVIFRVLYLRATATPHVTWLLSCTAMHMIESLGLHKDYSNQYDATYGPDTVACLFWVICAGNRVLSHELGRSPVQLLGVTRKFPFPLSDKSPTASLARLGCILPLTDDEAGSDNDLKRLAELMDTVENHTSNHTFIKLYAADVCFCLYRRLCVNNKANLVSRRESQQIMSVGRAAVQAVNLLVQRGQPWWNMLSTLFQFACVLISMDSPDSLGDLLYTVKTINLVRDCYPGTKVSQALSALKILIRASRQRKEQEATLLSVVEELETKPGGDIAGGSATMPLDNAFPELAFDFREWGIEDLEWATYSGLLQENSTCDGI